MSGKLIVFEGIDSSGKAVQCEMLVGKLKEHGYKVAAIGFPRYSEFFGSIVGKYLTGEFGSLAEVPEEFAALLYSVDRYQQKREIEALLASGNIVVSNRYSFSSIALQGAKFADKTEQKKFCDWIAAVESRMPKPDLVFLLDVPVEKVFALMCNEDRTHSYRKGKQRDLHESNRQLQERAREIYLSLAKNDPRWLTINCTANNSLRPKEEIASEIFEKAIGFLKKS